MFCLGRRTSKWIISCRIHHTNNKAFSNEILISASMKAIQKISTYSMDALSYWTNLLHGSCNNSCENDFFGTGKAQFVESLSSLPAVSWCRTLRSNPIISASLLLLLKMCAYSATVDLGLFLWLDYRRIKDAQTLAGFDSFSLLS